MSTSKTQDCSVCSRCEDRWASIFFCSKRDWRYRCRVAPLPTGWLVVSRDPRPSSSKFLTLVFRQASIELAVSAAALRLCRLYRYPLRYFPNQVRHAWKAGAPAGAGCDGARGADGSTSRARLCWPPNLHQSFGPASTSAKGSSTNNTANSPG